MLNIFLGSLPLYFQVIYCTDSQWFVSAILQSEKGLNWKVTDAISNNVKILPHNNLAERKREWRFWKFILFSPVTCPFAFLVTTTSLFSFLKELQQMRPSLLALLGVKHLKIPGWTSALSILTGALNTTALQANGIHLWGRKCVLYLSW